MILKYNYDAANTVLELLKDSKLASLTVVKHGEDYVMEYTLIEDYSEAKQVFIRNNLANALPERLKVTELMNQFIEHQTLGLVNTFALKFDSVNKRKCEIQFSVSFAKQKNEIVKHDEPIVQIKSCFEQLDNILVQIGANDQLVNVYRKDGTGRNKKYNQLTLRGVINEMRKSLEV